MKITTLHSIVLLSFVLSLPFAHAQTTTFRYQGRLNSNSSPFTGSAEFQPTLWDAVTNGNQIASNSPAQLIVPVTNGLFTLPLDFGANFPGANRWLQLEVRTTIGSFTLLTPRQQLTSTPYAMTASNITGTLPVAQLSGALASANLAGTYSGTLTLNNAANSFTGSGAGLTALNANNLGSGTVPDARLAGNVARTNQVWLLGGNAGTTSGTHFLGSTDNQPLEIKVNGMRALRMEPNTAGAPNIIGGSPNNFTGSGIVGATIGGGGAINYDGVGRTNAVLADYGTVGGGLGNHIAPGAFSGTIDGGFKNSIENNSFYAAIGGGWGNDISTNSSGGVIGGGNMNKIGTNSSFSAISGGGANSISNLSEYGTIAGGRLNTVGNSSRSVTIAGGEENKIGLSAMFGVNYSVISGGYQNRIEASVSSIGSGYNNKINSSYSVIGGGNFNTVNGSYAIIGGGDHNFIGTNSHSAILGGEGNYVQNTCHHSSIGGGRYNVIAEHSEKAVIGGGDDNTILWNADYSFVGGGRYNSISGDANDNAIVGGASNDIGTNVSYSIIGGGYNNGIVAQSQYSVIGGGNANYISSNSSYGVIFGGGWNSIATNAFYATIAGGESNRAAGSWSFAAGRHAKADHAGSFVWGDSNPADIASTNNNSITIRAAGGYRLFSDSEATAGVFLAPSGTSWAVISDHSAKKNFQSVEGRELLEKLAKVPVKKWNYNWESDNDVPHIGPMAQDFKAAFFPGRDDKSISTLEFDGVALAAIQGLNQKLDEKETRIGALEKELLELKQAVKKLSEKRN